MTRVAVASVVLGAVVLLGVGLLASLSSRTSTRSQDRRPAAPTVHQIGADAVDEHTYAAFVCRFWGVEGLTKVLATPASAVEAATVYAASASDPERRQEAHDGCLRGFERRPPSELPPAMRPANVYSPISQVRSGIAGKVVGRAFHYFVWSDDPARSLRDEMLGILSIVGFWTRDGPTVVRLLDDHGRSVWAAGIDDGKTWARVTPRLAGCGPVRFWDGRKVRALGRFDTSERCPAVSRARMTAMAGKVLR